MNLTSIDAFVSLISGGEGYVEGAIALYASLSKLPHKKVLMVEEGAYPPSTIRLLSRVGWELVMVPPLRSKSKKFFIKEFQTTFTKLHAWNLPYNKIAFLDADCLIMKHPKQLGTPFESLLAAPEREHDKFNSGVMVLHPNQEDYHALLDLLALPPGENGANFGEQSLLNMHFKPTLLPHSYNEFRWEQSQEAVIAHLKFKPWLGPPKKPGQAPYTEMWHKFMVAPFTTGRAYELIRRLPQNSVGAEIGVLHGRLSGPLMKFTDCTLHMVDPWKASSYGPHSKDKLRKETQEYFDEARKTASKVAMQYKGIIHHKTSEEAAPSFEDNSLDFIFIDANHDYQAVLRDIELWYPKVRPSGLVAGHDYTWPEVKEAVDLVFGDRVTTGRDSTWFVTV